jgi:endonuclease/exonuclease/phosphatase family metal-dependent hydrolase
LRKPWSLFFLSLLLAIVSLGAAWAETPAPAGAAQALLTKAAEAARKIADPAPKISFRVLSYNIKGLPAFAAPGFDEDRYGDIGRILAERNLAGSGPDIVTLQESFVSRTAELRALANFAYTAKGPDAANLWGVDSGLYILSRYPILKEEKRAFGPKLCASWDCYSNKGVQLARIQLPGAPFPIDVYNTHMQASRQSDAIRREQVKVILEFVKETHLVGAPIVFAGDFNFRPAAGDKSFADFQRGTALVHAGKLCLAERCPSVKGFDPSRLFEASVDHQFITPNGGASFHLKPLRAERNFLDPVKGRSLSDHLGYEVQYELGWAGPGGGAAAATPEILN